MWFLKKKSASNENASTQLEVDDIKFLIRCILDRGGSEKALFFAQAHGFSEASIDEDNLLSYLSAIKSLPQDVTEAGLRNAYELSTNDWGFAINTDVWPQLINDSLGGKNYSRSMEIVTKLEPIISSSSFTNVLKQFDFDFANFIYQIAADSRQKDLDKLHSTLESKKQFLKPLLKQAMVRGKNKYGELDYTKYFDEIDEFITTVFPEGSFDFFRNSIGLSNFVDNYVTEMWLENQGEEAQLIPIDGIEFEHWCSNQLEQQGWNVIVSQASGDQGTDLVASRDDFTVAVQCKRYSHPIGNSAVQEITAGKLHTGADATCVIGTGGFTKSAKELANSTDTKLLEAELINDFSDLFGFVASPKESNEAAESDAEENVKVSGDIVTVIFETLAERSIARSYFRVHDQMSDVIPKALDAEMNNNVDPDNGAGTISVTVKQFATFLHVADTYLSYEAPITDTVRQQLLEDKTHWHHSIGLDESRKTIFGFETYGKAEPAEIHNAFFRMRILAGIFEYDYAIEELLEFD